MAKVSLMDYLILSPMALVDQVGYGPSSIICISVLLVSSHSFPYRGNGVLTQTSGGKKKQEARRWQW
jgi:hypothetical protein